MALGNVLLEITWRTAQRHQLVRLQKQKSLRRTTPLRPRHYSTTFKWDRDRHTQRGDVTDYSDDYTARVGSSRTRDECCWIIEGPTAH